MIEFYTNSDIAISGTAINSETGDVFDLTGKALEATFRDARGKILLTGSTADGRIVVTDAVAGTYQINIGAIFVWETLKTYPRQFYVRFDVVAYDGIATDRIGGDQFRIIRGITPPPGA